LTRLQLRVELLLDARIFGAAEFEKLRRQVRQEIEEPDARAAPPRDERGRVRQHGACGA